MTYQATAEDEGERGTPDVSPRPPPPPPLPPPPRPSAPPREVVVVDTAALGANGGIVGVETDPLLLVPKHDEEHDEELLTFAENSAHTSHGGRDVGDVDVVRDDDDGDAEAEAEWRRHRFRRRAKRLLPWIGLALIVLSVVAAVCIVLFTTARTRSRGRRHKEPDAYDKVVRDYERAAQRAIGLELNRGGTSASTASVGGTTGAEPGCEGTVLILRHCDKSGNLRDDAGDEHCGYVGYERSQFLATLFGDGPADRWPLPSFMYAMGASRRRETAHKRTFRQRETLEPLSKKAGVGVYSKFVIGDDAKLARRIFGKLRRGEMCGKLAVVSWRHPEIPSLAQHLGCGPADGCPMSYGDYDFDSVWQIKFVYAPLRPRVSEPGLQIEAMAAATAAATATATAKGKETTTTESTASSSTSATAEEEEVAAETVIEEGGNDGPEDDANVDDGRRLKKKHHKKKTTIAATDAVANITEASPPPRRPTVPLVWEVHGTVVKMNFDPLSYSKSAGDYPPGHAGTPTGGRWIYVGS